jgi:phosphodiesterase/alkaline phosphatase D-like protein
MQTSRTHALLIAALASTLPSFAALPNGIAAGDTTATSSVLWARSDSLGSLTFDVYSDNGLTNLVTSVSTTVTDIDLPVKTYLSGLTSGTQYYYKATDSTNTSLTGKFSTFATSGYNGLRFGVSGDWRGELASYPAVKNVPSRDLAFWVSLGDTIYADDTSKVTTAVAGQATTIAEYRAKHQEVYTSTNGLNSLADLRASTTVFATIDDHEVTNDFAGGAPISSDSRFAGTGAPTDLINQSTLFKTGVQVFTEYNPIKREVYSGTGDARLDGVDKLYRQRSFGQDASLMMVDARSFRDTEIDTSNPATAAQVYTPGRTMLGAPQIAELKSDLLNAQQNGVRWKFVAFPEPAQQLGALGAGDRLEGYYGERTDLLKFIKDNSIQNTVFISADIHGGVVNDLKFPSNGNPFTGTSTHSLAWEITTGSVGYEQPFGPTVEGFANAQQLYGLNGAGGTTNVLGLLYSYGVLNLTQYLTINSLPTQGERSNAAYSILVTANPALRNAVLQVLLNAQLASDQLYGALDPIGLDTSVFNYTVTAGNLPGTPANEAFFQTFSFGWNEFEIDAITGELKVTTYGIPSYTEAELNANPSLITAQNPTVLSQFTVQAIPEPATTAAMAGLAALGLVAARRRRAS